DLPICLDRHAVRFAGRPEAGSHPAGCSEGGIEGARSAVAGEREVPGSAAGGDDLAVSLDRDRGCLGDADARTQTGEDLAAPPEARITVAAGIATTDPDSHEEGGDILPPRDHELAVSPDRKRGDCTTALRADIGQYLAGPSEACVELSAHCVTGKCETPRACAP